MIEFCMIHHVSEDVDGLVDEFRSAFYVITSVFVSGIGIEFASELVHRLGNRFRGGVFLPSFEKKMLQKVAQTVLFLGFVDASRLAHDLDGCRIRIFHRGENAVDSCDGFYCVLHDNEMLSVKC